MKNQDRPKCRRSGPGPRASDRIASADERIGREREERRKRGERGERGERIRKNTSQNYKILINKNKKQELIISLSYFGFVVFKTRCLYNKI